MLKKPPAMVQVRHGLLANLANPFKAARCVGKAGSLDAYTPFSARWSHLLLPLTIAALKVSMLMLTGTE